MLFYQSYLHNLQPQLRLGYPRPCAGLAVIRVEEGPQSNDHVRCDQERTFEVVTSPVQNKEVHHKRRNEEAHCFEEGKVQGHVLVHAPTKNYNQRSHKDS